MLVFRNLVFLIPLLWGTVTSTKLRDDQAVILQHAVKKMLGFKEFPSIRHHKQEEIEEAPKYMLDLYDRYKFSTIPKDGKRGNTVRMIFSHTGELNGHKILIFNLSSVMSSEKVFSAEIHLYKKKMKTRRNETGIELVMYQLAPLYVSKIGKAEVRSDTFGWQVLDVTESMQRSIGKLRRKSHLLGIMFKTRSDVDVPLKKFSKQHSLPYLVIFSNDTQNITLDHIQPRFTPRDWKSLDEHLHRTGQQADEAPEESKEVVSKEVDLQEAFKTFGENVKKETKPKQPTDAMFEADRKKALEGHARERRSIDNNEIPELGLSRIKKGTVKLIVDLKPPIKDQTNYYIPKTNPGILQGRDKVKQKFDPFERYSSKNKDSRKYIPYPKKYRKNRRRKNRRRNRNRHRNRGRGSRLPFLDDWDDRRVNEATGRKQQELCQKRKLVVDFADIGWSEWIISPKSFEAQYCAGKCPFPLTRSMRPSNHATIQSIVHAIGMNSDVPAPCCVPDSMSSVTLLYFDENRNVVLKNYPGMSVTSCGCR
ncbi:uncharacterized protein LOC135484122 [Lineus longissimus]|uniref:uncharacterized protein LOC135484122 n=1 Tax=Lineus longissimus TaxID=88925 RepID=UPI002B4F6684